MSEKISCHRPRGGEGDLLRAAAVEQTEHIRLALDQMCQNGYARLNWLPSAVTMRLLREAWRVGNVPAVRHRVNEAEWHEVDRVTLLPNPSNLKERIIGTTVFNPLAELLGQVLQTHIVRFGTEEKLRSLRRWRPTRIVYNYMQDGSVIPEHTDPENLSGLVIVNSLGVCRQQVNGGRPERIAAGTTTLIAAADLARSLDIVQVPHRITTPGEYVSVNLTNNTLPPSI